MNSKNKFLILSIIVIFIAILGFSYANNQDNTINEPVNNTNNSSWGCCSIILQEDGSNATFAYRRDANLSADISIEKMNWHGKSAIRQHKDEGGYFTHLIITHDGWMIGLGGLDDGEDNEICENITAGMVNDNYSISVDALKEIQEIKKRYKYGHALVKAPNGNYGFATVDMVKTGTLKPGHYISMPNNYQYSRVGEISPNNKTDKIKFMLELSQTDLFGLDRRDVITYDFKSSRFVNSTDIYVSNEKGSRFTMDYAGYADDVYLNKTHIKAEDIPISPKYKKIGTIDFIDNSSDDYNQFILTSATELVIFVVVLFIVMFYLVRFVRK